MQHAFCLSLPLFCITTTLFCRTKTSNFLVTHYFYGGIVCAYPIFCVNILLSCVHVRFYFSLPHIFTLLATSISHCLTAALNFHVFFLQNLSLLFSIIRSSSFSVIHVSVNIKNNVEKDMTLLLFFLSKSPGGHAILSFAFRLPYLLIELFDIGMPVVRTDGRAVGVRSRDYQIFSDW